VRKQLGDLVGKTDSYIKMLKDFGDFASSVAKDEKNVDPLVDFKYWKERVAELKTLKEAMSTPQCLEAYNFLIANHKDI